MGDLILSYVIYVAMWLNFTRTTCLEFHTFGLPVLH